MGSVRLRYKLFVILVVAILLSLVMDADAGADDFTEYIETVCEGYNICPELIEAVIERESGWDPKAENGGCIGLMQISQKWHKDRMERLGAKDLKNPYDNILVGVDYLAELFEKHEDVGWVLMTYNGDSRANRYLETGKLSEYAEWILERSAELEREHGK